MASSYSSNLRLEKPATGEKSGTWGDIVNTDFELIEDSISGYVSVAMGDANTTLSTANGSTDEARNMVVEVTGAHTAARDLIIPAAEKVYIVKNSTTGGYAVTVKVSGQTGASVPNGECRLLFCNGTTTYSAGAFLSTSTDNAFTAQQTITLSSGSGATPLEIVSTVDDTAVGPIMSLYRNNTGEASGDGIGAVYFYGTDSTNAKTLFAGVKAVMDDVTNASEDGSFSFGVVTAGSFAYELNLTGAALSPASSGGLTLGTATLPFGNVFLGSGTKLDFNNGDVTATHASNALTFAGATTYTFDGTIAGAAQTLSGALTVSGAAALNGGGTLGDASGDVVVIKGTTVHATMSALLDNATAANLLSDIGLGTEDSPTFTSLTLSSDLNLASGSVIKWNTTDVTLTHSLNTLTFASATTYAFDGTLAGAAATFSSTLGVTGATTLSSTLAVTGAITGSSTLSIGTSNALTAGTIELGHASDTTLARSSAGNVSIEGNVIYRAGGTDVAVADGGTGASTAAAGARALLDGLGTTKGNILWYNGSSWVALAPP